MRHGVRVFAGSSRVNGKSGRGARGYCHLAGAVGIKQYRLAGTLGVHLLHTTPTQYGKGDEYSLLV
jgi:hypothetical protein